MSAIPLTGAVEGPVDEVLLRTLVEGSDHAIGTIYVTEGKPNLLRRLHGFNAAARFAPWFVLVDLNGDECAPSFAAQHLPSPSAGMFFRVAVRAAEAWLLADVERMAAFLAVAQSRIPVDPDSELDPKQTVVNLARHSRKGAIRRDMVPSATGGRRVGPAYEARLIEFLTGESGWRPAAAAERSESLRRCLNALSA